MKIVKSIWLYIVGLQVEFKSRKNKNYQLLIKNTVLDDTK